VSEDERDIFTATYYFSWSVLTLFSLIVLVMAGFGLFVIMAQP